MRVIATGLLVVLTGLLAAAIHWEPGHPQLVWLRAFAEAGLVGGLADWFAVVALFRHPLAIPFPHTAILQRNKQRLGRELGLFVEKNFLTPANVAARLAAFDMVGWAARWCARDANARNLATGVQGALPALVEFVDDASIEQYFTGLVRQQLDQLDVAEVAASVLLSLIDRDLHQEALDHLIDAVGRWLDANRAVLRARIGSQSRWTPRWIDSYVVDKFVDGVVSLVDEIRTAPRHEIRASFDGFARGLVERLREDAVLREQANQLRHDIVERFEPERFVAVAWQKTKQQLLAPEGGLIEQWVAGAVAGYARVLCQDPPMRGRLNAGLLKLVEIVLARSGKQVSSLIADVVNRWDSREAARRIELEVGSDLQYIRINGSLVGGAAGLLIHAGQIAVLQFG
jgi:uncharacterized membrane-anchored protein YjiN (DUF445 family)